MATPEKFEAGMALQSQRLREALRAGMPRAGWKVGINVPEILRRLDLPHPGIGWLDGDRNLASGDVLEARPGSRLHVEAEVALRLSRRVPEDASSEVAWGCVEALHPALEIVDYDQPTAGLGDLVAHSMFHHATVLGPAGDPQVATELGQRWPRLRVGDVPAEPPRDDLVPAKLGELVAFAAAFLAAFGHALEPGDLLLSGSYMASASSLSPGDVATADFGPLGEVSVRIAAAAA